MKKRQLPHVWEGSYTVLELVRREPVTRRCANSEVSHAALVRPVPVEGRLWPPVREAHLLDPNLQAFHVRISDNRGARPPVLRGVGLGGGGGGLRMTPAAGAAALWHLVPVGVAVLAVVRSAVISLVDLVRQLGRRPTPTWCRGSATSSVLLLLPRLELLQAWEHHQPLLLDRHLHRRGLLLLLGASACTNTSRPARSQRKVLLEDVRWA
mmetsp:Transcript_50740/g.131954  ORF Transcript_50740/g.131954 Transcript_50740/m.131954 type:complete len:210 (-) Transcript_50740:65-694(-)